MDQMIELLFPEKGIDNSVALQQQRVGTTPVAVNVRLYEPSTDRARGGSRPGLVRFINQQLPLT